MKYMYAAVLCMVSVFSFGQEKRSSDSTTSRPAARHFTTFSGLLQMRYLQSLSDSVDINGKNFTGDGITSSFALKRVRLQARTVVNDHFDAVILMNLAEFSSNPQNRVLENAFIGYHLSKSFNLQFGQFRPYFGPEDILPADFIKSLDYSNQYYAFCNNSWQGFQMGASFYGHADFKKVGLNYYAGIYNGNNRNQQNDNDNQKNWYARLELLFNKNWKLGTNIAGGSNQKIAGNAYGVDLLSNLNFGKRFKAEVLTEFKEGTNFADYNSSSLTARNIDDYRMRGFYIYPDFKYLVDHPRIRSIEFSPRYELLDESYKIEKNVRQTVTPTFSVEFADEYFARLQVGLVMDVYKKDLPLTNRFSHSMAVAQLQVRF